MSDRLLVRPIPPADFATKFALVAAEAAGGMQVQFVIKTVVGGIEFTANQSPQAESIKSDSVFLGFVQLLRETPELSIRQAIIELSYNNERFRLEYSSQAYLGGFSITNPNPPGRAFAVLSAIKNNFELTTQDRLIADELPEHQRQVLEARQSTVDALKDHVTGLAKVSADLVATTSKELQRINVEAQADIQKRQQALEAVIEQDRAKLLTDRQAFERERAEFDNSQATRARRALQLKVDAVAKEMRDGLTSTSRWYFFSVHMVSAFILFTSAIAVVFAAKQFYQAGGATSATRLPELISTAWPLLPPLAACSFIFVGTLIFYLRWLSRQTDTFAHFDRSKSQLLLDLVRASWVAELLFEYKEVKQKELPERILTAFTEGLFKKDALKAGGDHPIDIVTSALKSLESVEVKDGAKINFRK